MARAGFKMQKVVREFVAYPLHFAREPLLRAPHIMHSFVELECGHIKRDPWEVYGNETAVRVQAGLHKLHDQFYQAGQVDEPPRPRKCRCRECVDPRKRQFGV